MQPVPVVMVMVLLFATFHRRTEPTYDVSSPTVKYLSSVLRSETEIWLYVNNTLDVEVCELMAAIKQLE